MMKINTNHARKAAFHLCVCTLLLVVSCLPVIPAMAQSEVVVTIERVEELECVDETLWWCGSNGDFYAKVDIAGFGFSSSPIDDDDDIRPNWTFRQMVDGNSASVRIEIWDSDGGLRFGDDHVDITGGSGRNLDLTVNLSGTCAVSGGISGNCGTTLTSSGTSDDRARVRFRVDVVPVRLGEVEVIVERLTTLECVDDFLWWCGSEADFYGRIAIDGVERSNNGFTESDQFDDQDDVAAIWRFTRWVNLNRPTVPIDIRIMDDDGWSNPDDTVDVQPGGGRVLELNLDMASCSISGEATGRCGDVLDVGARIDVSGNESDRGRMQFRIEVHDPPRLFVRCIHDPIWPQTGDVVTFTADVLDVNMRPAIADRIRLLQPGSGGGNEQSCSNASTCNIRLNAPAEFTFDYACLAELDGVSVTTGTRSSIIGPPATGRAVPVLIHRETAAAADLVFIPDRDDYSGASDDNFNEDVHDVIKAAYMSDELFLRNGDRMNYWIARDTGDAHGFTGTSPCYDAPTNWAADYSFFSDSGVILHTDSLRDCASGGIFSSEPRSINTVRHETGHSPFGLADEYCCDGGYHRTEPFPNLYGPDASGTTSQLADCQADALAGLRDSCIPFTSTRVASGDQFYRVDHAPSPASVDAENDRMLDNLVARAADERRIQWWFDSLP